MSTPPLILAAGAGSQHLVLGDRVTLKIHGRDSDGTLAQIESNVGPQIGPPLHIHSREDETFFVLEGEFEFICGDQRNTGGPGTVAFLPRNIPHRFKNVGSTDGRLLITMTPAGVEDFFIAVGKLTPAKQADLPKIIAMAAEYGLKILPHA
jgi:quercetin dioxygenase-like cupin family protein